MEAPEAAPEATPTFSAPDGEALGKVKDDALNKAQDLWKQGKAKLDKVRHLARHSRCDRPPPSFERPPTTEASRPDR